jgi:hypothetical protein
VNAFERGTEEIIVALENVAAEASKPLIGVFLDFHPPLLSSDEPDSPGMLPRFDGSVDAIQALSALTRYAEWRNRDSGAVPKMDLDTQAAKLMVNRILSERPEGRELTGTETAELLGKYGINPVPQIGVSSLADAVAAGDQLGWNVVLKATSSAVRGRPDLDVELDRLAGEGSLGLHDPVTRGITPGSGAGHLGLFGYDPLAYEIGRGALSAAGIGFELQPGDVAARVNFCTVAPDGTPGRTRRRRRPVAVRRAAVHPVSQALRGACPRVDFPPGSGGVRSERHAAARMVIPSMLARASAGVR